jgi:hypothetical protein
MGKPTSDNCYFEDVKPTVTRNGDIARRSAGPCGFGLTIVTRKYSFPEYIGD